MPGLSGRGLDHSVHASSTPQMSQQRLDSQLMNPQAPGFELSPVTFYSRMLQTHQHNGIPSLRGIQQDYPMQPYLEPQDENDQRVTNLESQLRQSNMAFRQNDLESRQSINLLNHEVQQVKSIVKRDIPWLNSRVVKLEQQAAVAVEKAGKEGRTHREKCRDAMDNPILVKIASGQYVPVGKTMVEAYISEAETAEALAAELRSYAIQAGADRSIAHSSIKKLDQLELSQPLAQLSLETRDGCWSEEELKDFRPSELDLVVNQWLQKNYAPLMVQTMGSKRWGQEFDLDKVMVHQSKMKAQAALHHQHSPEEQMNVARRASSPTSSERTLTEKTTNCAIRPDESISAVQSHLDKTNKPTGTSRQLTVQAPPDMQVAINADIPIPSTEDTALRNSKTWKPTYIARLPPLAKDKASHVPALENTETFTRSFLANAFGDHATQYSPGLYWVSKKVKCILPNRLFWIIDEDFEPFLPRRPGEHGAKLTAFFNPGGDDDGPGEDSYLNAPVFIARAVSGGSVGGNEKEYVYFGQYSQTRFSDKLDYDRMQEVVPNHVKEWWATTLAQTDRPPWMTEALINHFWPKPAYDGPLPSVPAAETDGDTTTAPPEAIMPKARKAMEHHLRDLAEFDKEDRLKVSFLTKEAIMKAFDEPDCASEPGLRLYWEYMECINWDAGFYAMLVAKKHSSMGPVVADTNAGARKAVFKPALRPGVVPKGKPATRGDGLDGSVDLPPPSPSSASTEEVVELGGNGEREGSEESSASTSTLESTPTVICAPSAPTPAGINEPVLFNPSLAMTLSPRLKQKHNRGKQHVDAGGVVRNGRGSFRGYDEDDYVPEYLAGDEKGGKKGKMRERKERGNRGVPY